MSTTFAPPIAPASAAETHSNDMVQAQEIVADAPVDQWGAAPSAAENGAGDFLAAAPDAPAVSSIDWWHPFKEAVIPLDEWVVSILSWVVTHFRPAFQAIRIPIDYILTNVELGLQSVPQPVMLLIIFLIAWRVNGRGLAIGSALAFVTIGLIGAWSEAMVTLSLVLTSLLFCILIGLPLGIAMARNDRLQEIMRPGLDAMQTTPAFVYLVPVVMLFGIGNVPGVVVTIIFALAPLIRLTNLGVRQVRPDLIEASRSFGASPWQLLVRVQLPLAMPTIMAGVNQALMLSLSMVVIASMIAVGGLGQMVLRGIGRLDMGLATVGGLGIVLMAIVLDRMTQSVGQSRNGS